MTVTAHVYGLAVMSMVNKEIDFDTDTFKVMLCGSGYTPNQNTHRYKSDVTNEVTGAGYTAGGQALTGPTVTYDAGTKTLKLDCGDPSWPSSTITARYAVVYSDAGSTDASKALLCYWDFGTDVSSSGGPFTLTLDAAGLVTATVA